MQPDPPEVPARLIGGIYFGTSAVIALCGAGLLWLPPALSVDARLALVISAIGFSVLCSLALWASRRLPRFPVMAALHAVAALTVALCGAVDFAIGDGVRSPTFGLCAVAVCVVGSVGGLRHGLLLGAAALLQSAALAAAERYGLRSAAPPGATPLAFALAFRALTVVCSVAGGALIARVIDHYLRVAAEREQRFRGLLNVAADWYWEQDQLFRYTRISSPALGAPTGASHGALDGWLRRTPWQIADMGLSDLQLDAHRADLESHLPFSGLLVRRRDVHGIWRIESLSGEPKFDAADVFRGYWGVARDVTDEIAAQRAMTASEARYRELFSRSPSPIFLHRGGLILDANQAAARLFGFASAAAMRGFNVAAFFPAGEPRNHMQRCVAELETQPVGEGRPVSDWQVRSIDGRTLSVQATSVRVDTASGSAVLTIFFDITARQAVEGALRRSEAMLSHLFATSADSLAISDQATGRYTMVNPAFCRLTGYGVEEAVGRTMAELGLWDDPIDSDRLAARLERDGTVSDLAAVFVAKSGARVSVRLGVGRFVMDQRDYLVVNARDVTASERQRLEHAAILDRASIGIAFTRNRRFVQANPYFEAMFGWPRDSLIGQFGSAVWASEAGEPEIDDLADTLLSRGAPFDIERQMRRRDASGRESGRAVDNRFWCRLQARAVDAGNPHQGGTIWIAEDITQRRRLDRALAAARDAAEAASVAKTAFLANTSHEIRTPLNAVLGLAELALQPELPEARRREYLAQIYESAESLSGIMSDILDVSKIEAGEIALDPVPFDLRDCLHAIHRAYQRQAEAKGVSLRVDIDPAIPKTVQGDPVRLRQIVSNFVSNALKFTEAGQVSLKAELTRRGETRLEVTDSGPGIESSVQARLFTPFSQGDTSTTRRYGGTGLGLSICRELAQLMGGRVGVSSTQGVGSTFWAELPLRAAETVPTAESTESSDLARLHGKRVLMVEDNPVNMMIGVAMLEQWGVRVTQAFDGRMAVDAVRAAADAGEPFAAVLMDVQMPIMSGHEATRELRRTFTPEQLPIIALTAAALVSERDEALRAGMDDFLTKPIDAARLRHALASRLT